MNKLGNKRFAGEEPKKNAKKIQNSNKKAMNKC